MIQEETELEAYGITKLIHRRKIFEFAQNLSLKLNSVFISHAKLETGEEAKLFYERLNANKLRSF